MQYLKQWERNRIKQQNKGNAKGERRKSIVSR